MNCSRFFIVFFLSSITFVSAASSQNDIESPILSNELDPQSQHYTQLRTEEDNTDDESNQVSNQSWTIPRSQFDVGLPIYGTIFGFLTSWELNDPISLFMRAIYIMSFLACVQVYFGFYLSCQRRPESSCPYLPEIVCTKIDFGRGPTDVSFGRWASGPFSWISEIFSFLPNEAYTYLENNAYFPPRSITHMIFMVQLLYYFGMYDCYRSNIMQPST